ncbi:unnamed protein product [Adineta ricciae]|uniref:Uncharacterized protein n=1 Tax=Adineta ricciae TaxID=249248 RepID=A0A815ED07_ADIRI|nr:unnamed protein product [Adineta ricciae]CAF1684055.1 unnamed protein product [Adineta ricciae]
MILQNKILQVKNYIDGQYQYCLESNDLSLEKQFVYKFTLPRFGHKCQYELYYYDETFATFYEIVREYYYQQRNNEEALTCYTILKCNRGHSPACLNWSEICDGVFNCLDGNSDEEHCWQLEFNQCEEGEYQCKNGRCIPNEFIYTGISSCECDDPLYNCATDSSELVFELEGAICETSFLTSNCDLLNPIFKLMRILKWKNISVL